jgi:hypothetical protein
MANAEGARLLRSVPWPPCLAASMLLIGGLAGCIGPERQPAVPEHLTEHVTFLGITNARF